MMNIRTVWKLAVCGLAVGCAASPVRAEVRLPALFSDHMVIQRSAPVPVWGWADAGEEVTVKFGDQEKTATADDAGEWRVELDAVKAGPDDPPRTLTVAGENEIEIENVLVGEVWVCSGQSNMEWPVSASNNSAEEIAGAEYPRIRLLTVGKRAVGEPREDVEGEWVECRPQTVGDFSAVGYFFGRMLHEGLDGVPIGLIDSSWGGTPAEAWTQREALAAEGSLAPLLERWDRSVAGYDEEAAKAEYEKQMEEWKQAAARAEAENATPPRRPHAPVDPRVSPHRPANLYNGMIAPLTPYAIRGVIWYQGESNAGRAHQYRTLFPLMIRNWREEWSQDGFPFYFVQLANFMERKDEPADSAWAELRDAQLHTMETVSNTGMAVTIDIGEANDIHPRNKQDVGKRLALWALAKDYGKDVPHSGPIFERAETEGDHVVLHFEHVGEGLVARGDPLADPDEVEVKGFAIAGPDGEFRWANAEIEGDTILVSHPEVESPTAVRYNWADNPEGNLYNEAGLPASPFRTDDREGITEGN